MRVAAFDIGTNTVLMLVAESSGATAPKAILERARITRLGEGVDRNRQLAPQAVERTLDALRDFSLEARELGVDRMIAVGTSAMRDAKGGDEFCNRAERLLGQRPQVISGEREAALTFRGALSGLPTSPRVGVFDVGGGSTEIVLGSAQGDFSIENSISLDIGSVRLTERHIQNDPPSLGEIEQIRQSVRSELQKVSTLSNVPLVGIAGTVTTLAAIAKGVFPYDANVIHGMQLSTAELRDVHKRLVNCSLAERREIPGLEPKRADVIVAGATLVLEVLEWANVSHITISDRGVRWGVAIEALGAVY